MEIQGYFTRKGLALSAKLLTGEVLTVTRVLAGSGNTADPLAAASLPQPRQALAVNTPTRSGNTATLPVTLAAALAEADYTLTELGVYARDPNEGEILYKVYRLDQPVDVAAGSRMVLRFYLEETVSQDLGVTVECSPAGLITEEAFLPVRARVLPAALPQRTVTVAAADLKTYLEGLPRMLGEHLTVQINGGAVEEDIEIRDLHSGSLCIRGGAPEGCVVRGAVTVENCSAYVCFLQLQFTKDGETQLSVINTTARVVGCDFAGGGESCALKAAYGSTVYMEQCKASGCDPVLLVTTSSMVTVSGLDASDFHDNTCGIHTWNGGIVCLAGEAPDTLGGAMNNQSGGIIVKRGTIL